MGALPDKGEEMKAILDYLFRWTRKPAITEKNIPVKYSLI